MPAAAAALSSGLSSASTTADNRSVARVSHGRMPGCGRTGDRYGVFPASNTTTSVGRTSASGMPMGRRAPAACLPSAGYVVADGGTPAAIGGSASAGVGTADEKTQSFKRRSRAVRKRSVACGLRSRRVRRQCKNRSGGDRIAAAHRPAFDGLEQKLIGAVGDERRAAFPGRRQRRQTTCGSPAS